jgi:hypothetical protein
MRKPKRLESKSMPTLPTISLAEIAKKIFDQERAK